MLDGWEQAQPGRKNVLFRALANIRPSHLLDPRLFDFAGLRIDPPGAGDAAARGDRDPE